MSLTRRWDTRRQPRFCTAPERRGFFRCVPRPQSEQDCGWQSVAKVVVRSIRGQATNFRTGKPLRPMHRSTRKFRACPRITRVVRSFEHRTGRLLRRKVDRPACGGPHQAAPSHTTRHKRHFCVFPSAYRHSVVSPHFSSAMSSARKHRCWRSRELDTWRQLFHEYSATYLRRIAPATRARP